jgi:hypothetical protein
MFRVWIVERKPTEGKSRRCSVREDINVEDTDTIEGERERERNLSYGKGKMVIKHDEEMAQNKMKVDKLLWGVGSGGGRRGDGFLKKRNTESHNRKKDSVYCRAPAGGDNWRRMTERRL